MKALVVGYGSIGERHTRILTSLGCDVAVVSSRNIEVPVRYHDLSDALASWQPRYVVIANKTSQHQETLLHLTKQGFNGAVLVEKPLFHEQAGLPTHKFQGAFVGYNLRFHPLLQKLRGFLRHARALTVQAYVGQYLPGWRTQSDYRLSYSANVGEGGGVLRDLSHELDYLNWLLGGWTRITALGGHYSRLEINSDDAWTIMMSTDQCPQVSVQLNYLDRLTRRRILINTDDHTVEIDLVKSTMMIDDTVEEITTDQDFTYLEQHRAVLENRLDSLCTFQEGHEVVQMIHAAEQSAKRGKWILR